MRIMQMPHSLVRHVVSVSDFRKAARPRPIYSDKHSHGTVLVVGGSSRYYGAPVMATNSAVQCITALRIGAGYVKSYVPHSILGLARSFSPNTIVEGLGGNAVTFNAEIRKEIERADVLAIGMGIGNAAAEQRAARKMIIHALSRGRLVVADAGAIACLRKIRDAGFKVAITPHSMELARLSGSIPPSSLNGRVRAAKAAALEHSAVVVLKGNTTIITDGSRLKLNTSRTAALSTMGTGDVLSGMIAAYAAICKDIFDASAAAVYLHSKIGDALHRKMGDHILATDVIDAIPQLAKKLG